MTFDEWAAEYFGVNVYVPESCRDAWNAATLEERDACANLCADDGYETGASLACDIRARSIT